MYLLNGCSRFIQTTLEKYHTLLCIYQIVEIVLFVCTSTEFIYDQTKQLQIKQVSKTLQKNETVSIHVNFVAYQDHSVHKVPIPEEYTHLPHVVWCTNYPESNKVIDFYPSVSNLDGTISQVTNINTQLSGDDNGENSVFAFVAQNAKTSIEKNTKPQSFNAQLIPNFTGTINWITTRQDKVDKFV